MIIIVTGINGQLGHDCVNELVRRGHHVIGSGRAERYSGVSDESAVMKVPYVQLDITDKAAVERSISEIHPDALVHCAAWTAVDAAEKEENRQQVKAVNYLGTRYLAESAKETGAKMLYLSTDYVFDGTGNRPWKPDDKDFAPLNFYGKTKLEGEFAVRDTLDRYFIVRIAWVYGLNGGNFVKTMIQAGNTHEAVRVVNDQIGRPTYTRDLARLLSDMVESEKYGFYHTTNEGRYISWFDFCCEIYRQYGLKTRVIPVSTAEYGLSAAARPKNSRLDTGKLTEMGFKPLPIWQDSLGHYLKEAML